MFPNDVNTWRIGPVTVTEWKTTTPNSTESHWQLTTTSGHVSDPTISGVQVTFFKNNPPPYSSSPLPPPYPLTPPPPYFPEGKSSSSKGNEGCRRRKKHNESPDPSTQPPNRPGKKKRK